MNTQLTPAQSVAYDLLLPFLKGPHDAHLAVLEGYAGTGKTYLVAALLRGACPGLRIAVAAPTNKAVRVLRDTLEAQEVPIASAGNEEDDFPRRRRKPGTGCTCRSIYSLLGLKVREADNGLQEIVSGQRDSTLRDYDIVVIDECSMLNDYVFKKIIDEHDEAQVLFVGDPAQLPPVSTKNDDSLLSPVFTRVSLKVRLTEVVRQAQDNPIIQLSIRIRQLIEADIKATVLSLAEVLPDVASGPKAALVSGTSQTLVDWWLDQFSDDAESDTRIIAYTNDRVQYYNQAIHHRLHGNTDTRFVAGERVIVHRQSIVECRINNWIFEPDRLITSDELRVQSVSKKNHPLYPSIPAEQLLLERDGRVYRAWVAQDELELNRQISDCFAQFRDFKSKAMQAMTPDEQQNYKQQSTDWSSKGWALRHAFADLQHAYAITCHKSQGSTFDCALVDFTDLSKINDVM